jgi:hypothetical protein
MASSSISLEYTADRASELRENIDSVQREVEQAARTDGRPAGLQAVCPPDTCCTDSMADHANIASSSRCFQVETGK